MIDIGDRGRRRNGDGDRLARYERAAEPAAGCGDGGSRGRGDVGRDVDHRLFLRRLREA